MTRTLSDRLIRDTLLLWWLIGSIVAIGTCQTTVYLRDNPAGGQIVSPGCTSTSPMTCTLVPGQAARFTVGDFVSVGGVASSGPNFVSNANGDRRIGAVSGNTVTLTNRDGSAITPNGTWSDGSNIYAPGGIQYIGKVSPYTVIAGPKVWWDGSTGAATHRWSAEPTALVCNGTICTITDAAHTAQAGDHVSVFNTTGAGSSTLNNGNSGAADWIVNSAGLSSTQFNFNASLTAGTFTSNPACGPGATPNGTIQGTDNCVRYSLEATQSNGDWSGAYGVLNYIATGFGRWAGKECKYIEDGGQQSGTVGPVIAEQFALGHAVDQANANYVSCGVYQVNNWEVQQGSTFSANETLNDGGRYDLSSNPNSSEGLNMGAVFGQFQAFLTPTQRQAAIDKVINDIYDPTPCTKTLVNAPHDTLATGTAQAGDATHITLAAGDAHADGYYVNNVVQLAADGSTGLVTNYVSSTKIATVTSWSASTPTTGSAYSIFSTVSVPVGVAQAGDSTHITLEADDVAATSAYNGDLAWDQSILSAANISAYNGSTKVATVDAWSNGSPANGHNYQILTQETSGTAQAGTSTSITLASGDTKPSGYYLSWSLAGTPTYPSIVEATVAGNPSYARVADYNGTTKVLTVDVWSNGTPTTGTAYKIFMLRVVGYNTNFTGYAGVRDAVYAGNNYYNQLTSSSSSGSWVRAVNSDTSLTVVQMIFPQVTTVPQVYWYTPSWATGACGWAWYRHYSQVAQANSQPVQFPKVGGYYGGGGGQPTMGSNNSFSAASGEFAAFVSMAEYDARAATKLSSLHTYIADYLMSEAWNYHTGLTGDGPNYGVDVTMTAAHRIAWMLSRNLSGYPDVGLTGAFGKNFTLYKIYSVRPDKPYVTFLSGHSFLPVFWANQNIIYPPSIGYVQDYGSAAGTLATKSSQYWKDYLNRVFGYIGGQLQGYAEVGVTQDIRIPASDYTAQPQQYLFQTTANAQCAALTWWTCDPKVRADAVYSRNGWGSASNSMMMFQARTFLALAQHDGPQMGHLQLMQAGQLIGEDFLPDGWTVPPDINADSPHFGSATFRAGLNTADGPAISNLTTWASANHGAWDTAYGDQNSRYVCTKADLSGAYTIAFNRVQETVCEFKKSGTEHVLVTYHDIDTTGNSTDISVATHYPQNGETPPPDGSGDSRTWMIYPEGTTSYPGGGCGNLNTNRTVLEQQDGGTSHGDPTRQYNLITKVVVPSGGPNLFVSCDNKPITISSATAGNPTAFAATAHGLSNGQLVTITANTGGWAGINSQIPTVTVVDANNFTVNFDSTGYTGSFNGSVVSVYPNGFGHTNKVRYCADSASTLACGATGQNGMELIQVHKIATQPDTSLTTTALNPDSSWAGVQTTDKVALFARHGATPSTMTGFTTTHAGTAQYLFAGFQPGTYTVTVNASPVAGSPFTVTSGDYTIYFESTAGAVVITQTSSGSSGSTTAGKNTFAGSGIIK